MEEEEGRGRKRKKGSGRGRRRGRRSGRRGAEGAQKERKGGAMTKKTPKKQPQLLPRTSKALGLTFELRAMLLASTVIVPRTAPPGFL